MIAVLYAQQWYLSSNCFPATGHFSHLWPAFINTYLCSLIDHLAKQGSESPQKSEKADLSKDDVASSSSNKPLVDPHLPSDRPVQKNKKRCWTCRAKLELVQQEVGKCKCGYVFCVTHRLPEQHPCIYNHKESGRQEAIGKMVQPKKHLGRSFHRLDSQPE